MRINVYSQELTIDLELVGKRADTGIIYSAVRFFLKSPKELHHTKDDDDRSAITFWLPKSKKNREALARVFERMAKLVREAPSETGLD